MPEMGEKIITRIGQKNTSPTNKSGEKVDK